MKKKTQKGFTLLELIVTLAIAGILLGFGVPGMRTLMLNNLLTTQANDLIADLNYARLEAIKLNRNVTITATDASDNTDDFGSGWTIWTDTDSNTIMDANERLRLASSLSGSSTLDAKECASNSISTFVYQPNGSVIINTANCPRVTIDLCDDRTAETGRQISIALSGRINTVTRACP